ncbi:MAG: CvpA family protein [Phycisphaeraceae bacterium]|nr:CvpA family protein [Phycisphaeraceae bacterium]
MDVVDQPTSSNVAALKDTKDKVRSGLMIGVAVLALACILFGSLPVKVVASVLAMCIIQGLWRGAAELIGLVAGMIVGVLLCRPIGRLLEPALASMTRTSGLSARLISVGLAAVVVSALVAVVIGVFSKRMMKKRPQLAGADKFAGGGIGLVEGCFLGLIILWVPLAMEPVARGQIGDGGDGSEGRARNPVAEAVVSFAEQVKDSSLGGVAESTNPMDGARIFALTGDFALVMRHRRAREHFVNSDAMRMIRETPSVRDAVAKLERDPELGAMIRAGDYGPEFVRGVLTSRSLVEVLDGTTVVRDLTPLVNEIEKALQEAKQIALGTR